MSYTTISESQPPCEAVSWNTLWMLTRNPEACQPPCEAVSWNAKAITKVQQDNNVSLLVRLWVEMVLDIYFIIINPSASLWGCELKSTSLAHWCSRQPCQPPCEAVSWNNYPRDFKGVWIPSASLWGCELKCPCYGKLRMMLKSASLWGCELKYASWKIWT